MRTSIPALFVSLAVVQASIGAVVAVAAADRPASTCGNGIREAGETCDDGNTSNDDDCPANCREEACEATPATRDAIVSWDAPAPVVGLTLLLDYPEGKVNLPVNGSDNLRTALTGFPAGTSEQHNVLGLAGHALREVVIKATPITPRPGPLLRVHFYDCKGATPPAPSDFTCTVTHAFAPDGKTEVAGSTCSVSLP